MARSDNTEFVVEVLEGPLRGFEIPLVGRSAPYRSGAGGSISYGVQQRTKLVWYQGNPVATQHVFGPTIDPMTINGVWKDRYLGEDESIDLVETFEFLCETGVQVRVFWSTIERTGLVKAVKWRPGIPTGGLGDIGWDITFEWNSKGIIPSTARAGAGFDVGLRDRFTASAAAVETLNSLIESFSDSIGSTAGLVRRAAIGIANDYRNVVGSIRSARDVFVEAARSLGVEEQTPRRQLEDATAATEQATDFAAQAGDTTAGVYPFQTSDDDGVDAVLLEAQDKADITDQIFALIELVFELQRELEALLRPEAFAEIIVVEGTDLRAVSNDFYGTPDRWDRIAKANGIKEGSLIPLDVRSLLVPLTIEEALDDKVQGC